MTASTAQPRRRHQTNCLSTLPHVPKITPAKPISRGNDIVQESERHLIYHIWPGCSNGMWEWNVEQLLKRIDLFNGIRTIGIAVDNASQVKLIQAAFEGHRIDNWIIVENAKMAGEASSFYAMLNTLPNHGVTFYGHAKGVSHVKLPPAVKLWSDIQYRVCLDQVEAVQVGLQSHSAIGCYRQHFPSSLHPTLKDFADFDPAHSWHFAGTFFWFKNNIVFSRHNQTKDYGGYYQIELWPSKIFRIEESYTLFGSVTGTGCGHGPGGDLYDETNQENIYATASEAGLLNRPIAEHYKFVSHLTDKGSWHSYLRFYDHVLEPYKNRPTTLLEIGVREGGSLLLWDRVLTHPKSLIIGIDLVPHKVASLPSRVTSLVGDILTDDKQLPTEVDVVIDDGSHTLKEQIATFRKLFPLLRHGGLYVIEDIQGDDDCEELQRLFPQLIEVDLRAVKGRYDDRILCAINT